MQPGDPPCASKEAIEAWIDKKSATYRYLNSKVDFISREDRAVSDFEIYLVQAPLKTGWFTDGGHRFRYNKFKRADHWWKNKK
jgi:hypothetical protein